MCTLRPSVCRRGRRPPDEQRARGGIPRLQADFPEGIGAARCDISEIERGRAGPANAGGVLHHGAHHAEVGIDVLHVGAIGKARGDERALRAALLAHADAVVVEVRAAPRDAVKSSPRIGSYTTACSSLPTASVIPGEIVPLRFV